MLNSFELECLKRATMYTAASYRGQFFEIYPLNHLIWPNLVPHLYNISHRNICYICDYNISHSCYIYDISQLSRMILLAATSGIPIAGVTWLSGTYPHSVIIFLMTMMTTMMMMVMMMFPQQIPNHHMDEIQNMHQDLIVWPSDSTQGKIPWKIRIIKRWEKKFPPGRFLHRVHAYKGEHSFRCNFIIGLIRSFTMNIIIATNMINVKTCKPPYCFVGTPCQSGLCKCPTEDRRSDVL